MPQTPSPSRSPSLSQPLGPTLNPPFAESILGVSGTGDLSEGPRVCTEAGAECRGTQIDDDDGFLHIQPLFSQSFLEEQRFSQCMNTAIDVDEPQGDQGSEPLDTQSMSSDIVWDRFVKLGTLAGDDVKEPELDTTRLASGSERSGEVVDSVAPSFNVSRCAWTLQSETPKFFWETDPFLKTVFCGDDGGHTSLKRPEPPIDLTVGGHDSVWDLLKRQRSNASVGICADVIKHVEPKDECSKRASIISNWSSLVCIKLDAFSLYETLAASGETVTHADVETSLTACFSRKATSTLSKRFYALNRFVNYCCRSGLQFFPLRENVVFTYLRHLLEEQSSAPSSGRSLLEALRFAGGTLGLRGDILELGSTRIDGLAVELSKRAGPIQQAAPLSVQQVVALERLVVSSEDLMDRATFGGMLVLLYACGRFSDGQRSVNMILDVDVSKVDASALGDQGYIELQVIGHKGARGDVLRRTFLPLVAPVYSLGNVNWFQAWLQAREALGLVIAGKLDKPFLCRFNASGEPLNLELTSAECSALLRRALKLSGNDAAAIRSHSLKTTPLSWCCKYGVSLETRRLLGHHLDPGSWFAETYGRDSMSPAVRSLESVLNAIKCGNFRPDESRSGRFVKAQEVAEVQPVEQADEESDDSDNTYEPSSSDSDETDEIFGPPSDTSLLWHLVMPDLRPGFVQVPAHVMVYRNVASGVQHLKKPGSMKLMCGRKQTDRYCFYAGMPVKGVALCEHCMSSKGLQISPDG